MGPGLRTARSAWPDRGWGGGEAGGGARLFPGGARLFPGAAPPFYVSATAIGRRSGGRPSRRLPLAASLQRFTRSARPFVMGRAAMRGPG